MIVRHLVAILLGVFVLAGAQTIPTYLLPCYRGNETQPWLPNSMPLLIELVRKIEDARPTSLDARTLSVQLFHRLRFDGIEKAPGIQETEFVTPFGITGIMAPKMRLLRQLISPPPGESELEQILSQFDLCALHRLISSSVQPFERGDEARTCPLNLATPEDRIRAPWITRNKVQNATSGAGIQFTRPVSRCPLELGITQTRNYGTVSPGTLIAAVAAGLQPQNVQISEFIAAQKDAKDKKYANLETMDEVNIAEKLGKLLKSLDSVENTFAAGLAGDLAEVCVYQGPFVGRNVAVGLPGNWNDTFFPREKFLVEGHGARWEMTRPELISGIDGMFISQEVSGWVDKVRRLRLSQVLDMYYSPRGVPSLTIEHSGGRTKGMDVPQEEVFPVKPFTQTGSSVLRRVFEDPREWTEDAPQPLPTNPDISNACDRRSILEIIDREKLKEETFAFAQILQFTTSSLGVTDARLRSTCDAAVDKFYAESPFILDSLPHCNQIASDPRKPAMDVFVIIDGSRREYENLQLINYLTEVSEVSTFGSTITVIHGGSGEVMVNQTNSISSTFEQLRNFTNPFPTTFSLSRSFQRLLSLLSRQTDEEIRAGVHVARSQLALVFSQSQRITQNDFESAQRILQGSLQRFPDLYFIFVTSDVETFENLIRHEATHTTGSTERFTNLVYPEHYTIIRSTNISPDDFSERLVKEFRKIPMRMVAARCLISEFNQTVPSHEFFEINRYRHEDYIGPYHEIIYRISPFYFRYSESINVQFLGVDYGGLTICASRNPNAAPDHCQSLRGMEDVWFNHTWPCGPNVITCPPIFYSVNVDVSNVRCSENDCRYPDQVRFHIQHHGLTCERGSSGTLQLSILAFFASLLAVFTIKLN
uniref:Putative conserved secreted protein n=1 Tax=Lutzomyia longipalpis TaxID=7200 RepID=A0A7G3A9X6_LUTLO